MDLLLDKELKRYETMLEVLKDIEVGDKLYYENGEIKILKSGYMQSLTRLIYSQNRNLFLEEFKKDIKNLNKLFNSILLNNHIILFSFVPYNQNFINRFNNIHKNILKVIEKLLKTYEDDEEFIVKLRMVENSIRELYNR